MHVSEEERTKMWSDIFACRKALVEHGMLRRPEERTSGFLTTTLRRYINRSKMDQMVAAKVERDYDKLFKRNYWSYSKSMLRQPLTVRVDLPTHDQTEDMDDVSLKLFYSIQLHAGKPLLNNSLLTVIYPHFNCHRSSLSFCTFFNHDTTHSTFTFTIVTMNYVKMSVQA